MSLLTQASLVVTPNGYKEGTLYSVVPNNSNGDFTVTRATTATRVNAAGLVELVPYNLLSYSEMFADAYWTKVSVSVTANTTTAPNGTLTADKIISSSSLVLHFIYNTPEVFSQGDYCFSVYVKAAGFNKVAMRESYSVGFYASFDLTNGTIIDSSSSQTNTITAVGNGWYRITSTRNFVGNIRLGLIPLEDSYTGGNPLTPYAGDNVKGIFAWGAQVVQGTSALDYQMTETRLNIPRLDYSLGSCPNILLEPQRTNLLLNSQFNGAISGTPGTSPTSYINIQNTGTLTVLTNPIGSKLGFITNGSNAKAIQQSVSILSNTTYVYSLKAEVLTQNVFLQYMQVGLPSGATAQYVYNGTNVASNFLIPIGECNLQIIITNVNAGSLTLRLGSGISGNTNGNIIIKEPQLEAGAYATSYIPTSSASVTRNADVISRGNIFTNGLITASGGTWFVDFRNNVPIQSQAGGDNFMLSEFGNFSGAFFRFANDTAFASRLRLIKLTGGVLSIIWDSTTTNLKVAIKWNGSTADVFANGVKVVSATAFTETALNFISNGGQATKTFNSMALFPTPLTDGEMSMLTSGVYTPALAYAQLGLVSESPACLDSSVNALL
jgi:hypothetical protein